MMDCVVNTAHIYNSILKYAGLLHYICLTGNCIHRQQIKIKNLLWALEQIN